MTVRGCCECIVFRRKWREAGVIGLIGFFAPFLGTAAVARFLLGWDPRASWLAGVALSTTSVAVVYGVMLELGFNRTEFGKAILALLRQRPRDRDRPRVDLLAVQCQDAHFRPRQHCGVYHAAVHHATLFREVRRRVSELEAKFLLFALFIMGGLAVWAGSEAVLPAYVIGMVLAGTVGNDHVLIPDAFEEKPQTDGKLEEEDRTAVVSDGDHLRELGENDEGESTKADPGRGE
jgi:glutathione-regulated potassium-efflux system ancillary protein KefC